MCHPDKMLFRKVQIYSNIMIVLFLFGSIFFRAPIEVPIIWAVALIVINTRSLWRGFKNEHLE